MEIVYRVEVHGDAKIRMEGEVDEIQHEGVFTEIRTRDVVGVTPRNSSPQFGIAFEGETGVFYGAGANAVKSM